MGGIGSGRIGSKLTLGGTRCFVLETSLVRKCVASEKSLHLKFRYEQDELDVFVLIRRSLPEPHILLAHHDRRFGEPERYAVSLTRTHPHLGGIRWWFRCPETGLRAAKLYLPLGGRRFKSRQAYGLVHDSRQMSKVTRQSRRITGIAAKMGAANADFMEPPERPLRMRWKTYARLVEQWYHARDAYWATLSKA
jgi:hypothetical protein